MHAMNLLPLQVTAVATLLAVAAALWIAEGPGLRARLRDWLLAADRLLLGMVAILASAALAIAVLAGLWQVIARFATETPSIWSEALVRTALIWMAYRGVGLALRAGALVSIDVAHQHAPPPLRRALEAAALACSLSLMGIIFWFGWSMAERVRFQEMAGLEVSMAWGYSAIPVGAAFAILGALANFLDRRAEELENAQ
jgi:TRAP-type C4-dicarboxylate transport system permease small subunit